MKAVVITGPGKLEVVEKPEPRPGGFMVRGETYCRNLLVTRQYVLVRCGK